MRRPNILYIHSHDTGRYVQPYGYAVHTPSLQRLAEQGLVFRQAFCAAPTCSPSRAALLTGQSPHNAGMLGLAHRGGFALYDYGQHLVHTLRGAGYVSTLIGFQHVADDPNRIGYDRVIPHEGSDAEVARRAEHLLGEGPEEPFFLSVGFISTHRNYPPPVPADDPRYCRPPGPIPDTPQTRRDTAGLKTSVRTLDLLMGRVIGALDAAGLSENTLVICTTDHGIAFPRMKCNLTDGGTGVMLIMRGPGGFSGGRVIDALVSQIDIYPTLCELLEIEPPAWLQGSSMMPLVRGERDEINEEVFSEVSYHAAYEPQRAVRTRRWKYVRRFGKRRGKVILPNCDDGPSKELWLEHGWRERPVAEEQLYDLVFDPNEAGNLARDPDHADVLGEMRGRLERWMRATEDPLLQGFVEAPDGTRVNHPDGLSPDEPLQPISGRPE